MLVHVQAQDPPKMIRSRIELAPGLLSTLPGPGFSLQPESTDKIGHDIRCPQSASVRLNGLLVGCGSNLGCYKDDKETHPAAHSAPGGSE
jgi:hypothetical protein